MPELNRNHGKPDMQNKSYRYLFWPARTLFLISILYLSFSCSKNPSSDPPGISFLRDSGFVYRDTSLIIGARVRVGVTALAAGGNITFFQVSCDNGKKQILLDSGLNHAGLTYSLAIIKSASSSERWTFLVMDRNRNKDSISIVLGKSDSSHYGKILSYPDLLLGAQENTSNGSFLSFPGGQIYTLDEAYLNQSAVDLVYYFGPYEATLSSPNEAEAPAYFTGTHGIANWTVKNETRYDTTSLSPFQYDEARNDSLLLAVYEPAAGKRKAKFVSPGMVISFKNAAGKIGLIKISAVEPGPSGSIRCSLKVQE